MHNILRLPGARALSAFRLDKLLRQAREALPKLSGIRAQHWHFVKLVRPLAASEQEVLEKLLTYGPSSGHEDLHDAIVLVVPRLGTISPWSSKATDIAHACGLDAVERIERGTGVRFELPAGVVLDAVARRSLLPLIHDRMTETVLSSLAEADALFRHAKPQPLTAVDLLGRGAVALEEANRTHGPGAVAGRDRLSRRVFHPHPTQSHGCGADDVRASQLRALPAQDLQCRLDHRRRGHARLAVPDDQAHPCRAPGGNAGGLRGQCRGDRGCQGGAAASGCAGRVSQQRRVHAHRHEGGDAQPSDRYLAVSRRRDRLGRRDPRRGCHGTGRQAEGGTDRVHRLAPARSGVRATLGEERVWPPGPHRFAAADHAGRPDRRRQLQQRIRAPQPVGLLSHLRAAARRRAARLSQADHDCRRRGQRRASPDSQAAAGRRGRAGATRRARHADRAGWRLGVQHGDGAERRGSRLRFGAAGQCGDPAPGPGSHRPLLGAGRREPDPVDPRCGRGRVVERVA